MKKRGDKTNNKSTFFKGTLLTGLALLFVSFILRNPAIYKIFPEDFVFSGAFNALCGGLFGLGGGLTSLSTSNLFMHSENPKKIYSSDKEERKKELDLKEKRIRAKAAASDVLGWAALIFAYVLLMLNMPLWTVLGALIIFGLNFAVWGIYMKRK